MVPLIVFLVVVSLYVVGLILVAREFERDTLPATSISQSDPLTRLYAVVDTETNMWHGEFFPSLSSARDYAFDLRKQGKCFSFRIDAHVGDDYFEGVYSSSCREVLHKE